MNPIKQWEQVEQSAHEWCKRQPESRIEGCHVMYPPMFPHAIVFVVRSFLIGRTRNFRTHIEY